MASTSTDKTSEKSGNSAVPAVGDHDRVAMLSLNADGTPDQHAPEIIGDKAAAVAAAEEQFAQQAVSAYDQKLLAYAKADADSTAQQDPGIQELTEAHEKTAEAAKSAAQNVVDSLHQG